ncbi:MAG: 3-hydroxyacyl-ACP dehydratase FabZ family protein [Verrucomicrobiota bacterium]
MTEVEKLIPHRPPFLFVDEIISHDGETLVARRTWRADEEFYKGHYPGAPITPGVLLSESVFQTGACLMARLMAGAAGQGGGVPLLSKVSDIRFRLPVYPGDTVTIEVKRKETAGEFHFLTGVMKNAEGRKVMNVEFAVAWKKPEGQVTA